MRKLMVMGLSALSTMTLMVGPAAPAANAIDLGLISGLCSTLPGTVVNIGTQVAGAAAAVTSATADSVAKQGELGVATSNLVTAVVAHIKNVNAGNDGGATAPAVGTAITDYANKTVAANNAFNKLVDAQRTLNLITNSQAFAQGVNTGLCVPT